MKRFVAILAVLIPFYLGSLYSALAEEESPLEIARPPQFVMIAFDNCEQVSRWRELSVFLRKLNQGGNPVRMTFFVSGVNYLTKKNRKMYQGPRRSKGRSNIDFGGTARDVSSRIFLMNELHAAGNEIASHAVGHFDARDAGWSRADWRHEFETYNRLFDNVAPNNARNDFTSPPPLALPSSRLAGFRAPYLATNSAMYDVLKEFGFRYDTSSGHGGRPHLWPSRHDKTGLWLFKLALVRLQRDGRQGRRVLSMDYNFCATHARRQGGSCKAKRIDAERTERYGREMYDTYVKYFTGNYMGNRAPLHIGHHFSAYHSDTYNKVLKIFATRVCKLKEVRCVTYRELADFMDALPPDTLAAYRKGEFSRDGVDPPRLEPLDGSSVETQ